MNSKIFIISILLTAYFLLLPSVAAQTATDSAISEEEITQSIKQRLEKVAKDATESGAVLGSESLKRAWVGTLEDIANHTLTIKTLSDTKQAEVVDKAIIIGKQRQPLKLESLEIGSFVIAMGYLGNNQVLDARRVVVSDRPQDTLYRPHLVNLKSINKASLSVTDTQDEAQSFTLSTTKSTTFTQTMSGEQSEIELSDLQTGDNLIIIAKADPKLPTTLDTVAVHLVTSRTIPASTPEATSSAKPE